MAATGSQDHGAEEEAEEEADQDGPAPFEAGWGPPEDATPAELKALGNEAWKRQDIAGAVELWNKALRVHVEAMGAGGDKSGWSDASHPSALSEESMSFESSVYKNLAQGLLRLGEPARALRACRVVLQDSPKDVKARYRAAEAQVALDHFDEANILLSSLAEDGDAAVQADVARLRQRMRAGQQADARRQKQVAKRMWGAAEGFSDGRESAKPPPDGPSRARANLAYMDPTALAVGCDIAEAAAKAAQAREARLEEAEETPLPEPSVPPDLDAFRARIMAKTSKYGASIAKSQQKRRNAQQSLKLQWLRGGQEGTGLDAFKQPLQEELRSIEAQGREAAEAEDAAEGEAGTAEAIASAVSDAATGPHASLENMDAMD